MRRLDALDIPYDVTPGVPAYAAAAATLGRELTVPEVGQTVILSRISGRASAMPPGEDLATLGASQATLVLHLAVQQIDRVVEELVANYGPDCPVAVVARASREDELIVRGTLADIADQVKAADIRRTAVIIVGKVLSATTFRDSHLYSPNRIR
jgi:precorrin-4/cobalt-precorrin-4 C11-methyltransferase